MKNVTVLLVAALCCYLVAANENPAKVDLDDAKVKIIDNSRVLTAEEVDKMAAAEKQSIPVVVPLLKKPARPFEPKIGVVVNEEKPSEPEQPKEQEKSETVDNNVKLPPIPLIMPPFLHNIFDSPVSADSAPEVVDSDKPKGIVSVLLLKSQHIETSDSSSDQQQPQVKSSFVIFRFLPKSIGNMFGLSGDDETDTASPSKAILGGETDPDNQKRSQHLLGAGDDDVDKKRMRHHMMGGMDDPDHLMRFDMDENSNKGVFTGGNPDVYTGQQQHRMFVFSMFDRLRSMFDGMRQSMEQRIHMMPMGSIDDNDDDDDDDDDDKPGSIVAQEGAGFGNSLPFISIRTDDGRAALIPNDFEKQQAHEQSLNKCMMLQFMRLKASMYYRTILHLLFFTGVLLFILSLLFLVVRTCKRRRFDRRRHHHHHHHRGLSISSIESAAAALPAGAKSKLASYKAWQGMDQSSLIEPSDKVVLIQAPPAYDQVYIHDKNSTLTSSDRRQSAFSGVSSSDECETKSLPPDYEEQSEKPAKN